MIKKEELKIGERVTITLEAVERNNCEGYFFDIQEGGYTCMCKYKCCKFNRSDCKNIIFKEVKMQKRKMKENKHSLKISRSCGNITLDGYPIATYSNNELKILKRLLTKVLGEVNEYIHL